MIKKFTTSHKGKKYSVIIDSDDEIIIGKIYPARYEEAVMSNKAPVWFAEFEKKNDARWDRQEQFNKEVISRLDNLEKDMKQVKQDIVLIKNCPTIKAELQHSN